MSERVATVCDQCGQTDDHPKVHLGSGPSKHHDCLSASEKEMVSASSPQAEKIIDACVKGKRGKHLLAVIESLHEEESN
jgi:hypothetical protein